MSGIRNVDRWMLASVVALLAIGITMVLNTSYLFAQERFGDGTYLFRRQLAAAGLGLAGLSMALLVPPPAYRRLAGPLLIAALVALVLVLIPDVGVVRGGAHRWLGVSPFVFQPSELAKVCFVLYLAYSLSRRADRLDGFVSGCCPAAGDRGVRGPAAGRAGLRLGVHPRHPRHGHAVRGRRPGDAPGLGAAGRSRWRPSS